MGLSILWLAANRRYHHNDGESSVSLQEGKEVLFLYHRMLQSRTGV